VIEAWLERQLAVSRLTTSHDDVASALPRKAMKKGIGSDAKPLGFSST